MCIPVMEFCQELMQYPEEEQPYAKAVISSVLCGIITSMDIAFSCSLMFEPFREFVKKLASSNNFYFSVSLLYSLLFYVKPSTLRMVVDNLNWIILLEFLSCLI